MKIEIGINPYALPLLSSVGSVSEVQRIFQDITLAIKMRDTSGRYAKLVEDYYNPERLSRLLYVGEIVSAHEMRRLILRAIYANIVTALKRINQNNMYRGAIMSISCEKWTYDMLVGSQPQELCNLVAMQGVLCGVNPLPPQDADKAPTSLIYCDSENSTINSTIIRVINKSAVDTRDQNVHFLPLLNRAGNPSAESLIGYKDNTVPNAQPLRSLFERNACSTHIITNQDLENICVLAQGEEPHTRVPKVSLYDHLSKSFGVDKDDCRWLSDDNNDDDNGRGLSNENILQHPIVCLLLYNGIVSRDDVMRWDRHMFIDVLKCKTAINDAVECLRKGYFTLHELIQFLRIRTETYAEFFSNIAAREFLFQSYAYGAWSILLVNEKQLESINTYRSTYGEDAIGALLKSEGVPLDLFFSHSIKNKENVKRLLDCSKKGILRPAIVKFILNCKIKKSWNTLFSIINTNNMLALWKDGRLGSDDNVIDLKELFFCMNTYVERNIYLYNAMSTGELNVLRLIENEALFRLVGRVAIKFLEAPYVAYIVIKLLVGRKISNEKVVQLIERPVTPKIISELNTMCQHRDIVDLILNGFLDTEDAFFTRKYKIDQVAAVLNSDPRVLQNIKDSVLDVNFVFTMMHECNVECFMDRISKPEIREALLNKGLQGEFGKRAQYSCAFLLYNMSDEEYENFRHICKNGSLSDQIQALRTAIENFIKPKPNYIAQNKRVANSSNTRKRTVSSYDEDCGSDVGGKRVCVDVDGCALPDMPAYQDDSVPDRPYIPNCTNQGVGSAVVGATGGSDSIPNNSHDYLDCMSAGNYGLDGGQQQPHPTYITPSHLQTSQLSSNITNLDSTQGGKEFDSSSEERPSYEERLYLRQNPLDYNTFSPQNTQNNTTPPTNLNDVLVSDALIDEQNRISSGDYEDDVWPFTDLDLSSIDAITKKSSLSH